MIKSEKYWKFIYTIISLLGISILVYGINLYELTFININVLLFILVIFSIPTYFLIRDHYAKLYSVGRYFYPIFTSITSVGFLAVTFFLMLNYHLADVETKKEHTLSIIKSGELSGRGKTPYAEISYNDKIKRVLFKSNDVVRRSHFVYMKTLTGFLGFEIIIEKKII